MAFQSFELTNDGINLLAQVQAELGTLNFTRIKIGDGDYTGDIKDLTDIISEFHNFPVTSTSVQPDSSVKIQAPFTNETFTQSYTWREIGVYAKLGDTGVEILYSYSKDPTPEIIPDYDGGNNIYRRTLDIRNYISDVGNVTLEIVEITNKYDFSTTLEMKTANYLTEGDRVKTWGDLALGDDNGSDYIIGLTGEVLLDNGLYAKESVIKQIVELQNGKEDSFTKNTAFNKNFGDLPGDVGKGEDVKENKDNIDSFEDFSNNIEIHYDDVQTTTQQPLLSGHPIIGYAYIIVNSNGRGGEIIWNGKTTTQNINVGYEVNDVITVDSSGTAGGGSTQGASYIYSYKKLTK